MNENIPQSHEAECSVLGAILTEPELIHECELRPEEFFNPRHALIMDFMNFLRENYDDQPVDIVLLANHAGDDIERIGGIPYLAELMDATFTTANFRYYHDLIREKYEIRTAMGIMEKNTQMGQYAVGSQSYIDGVIQALEALRNDARQEHVIKPLTDVLKDHDETIRQRKEMKGITGTKSCSNDLDQLTGGYQKGDLIIVAARPNIGKTAFIVNDAQAGQVYAKSEEIEGSAAYIVSLEMKDIKIAERCICAVAGLDSNKLKTGEMTDDDWELYWKSKNYLEMLNIFICDNPSMTLQQLGRDIKKLVKKYPNLTLYLDYLQLLDCGNKKYSDDPAKNSKAVSRGLKKLAIKCDIPIVAISAVGRGVEQRQDKRPMLSDLRESGSIESDADMVVFLYREDYYNRNAERKNIIELILAKARDSAVGLVEMLYLRWKSKFYNLKRPDPVKQEGAPDGESKPSDER